MATQQRQRKRRKRVTSKTIAYIYVYGIFLALFLTGFLFGRITKPTKIETEYITETEYIPILTTSAIVVPNYKIDESDLYNVPFDKELQAFVKAVCEEENVDVSLVYSMINTESEFDPDVISKSNDYGLMQINKSNHEWLAETYDVDNFLDPFANVYCGVKIIGSFLEKYNNDYNLALMCYNMGETGAKECWEKGIYSSRYSREIVSNMKLFEEVANGN